MKQNKIFFLAASSAIFLAFVFGYLFAQREFELSSEKEKLYIDISTSTRNITIQNSPEHIFFRVNGELIQTGSIDLK